MYIIKKNANANGSRPAIQTWARKTPPEGYAFCPEEFFGVFYSTEIAGFVNIEVEGDSVVSMEVNEAALEAYLASIPEPTLSPEEEISMLKAKLAASDYQAIKYAEGYFTDEEYAPIRAERQAWRNRINELEALIGAGGAI
jgi:hypothetical protein